ncbi:MAG: GNAT family N-acetyltransferase, partial [Sphingomonas sp.]
EMSDGVAGFVAMSPHDRQLEQIFVAPAFHRRGVGAALLAHARTVMPEGFTLWTHGDNHGAARFYDAVGMELLGPAVHPRHGYPILTYAVAAVPQ